MTASFFDSPSGRKIAYHKTQGDGPGIVFCGGFKSDMGGTKAVWLEQWAKTRGRGFLRFDYSGHGESSEAFIDGSIGEWAEDAQDIISAITDGPQILVGSSMGGWISCLLARQIPARIAGFVGIAAAPDFTEDDMWPKMSQAQRQELMENGVIYEPSEYGEPLPITRKLIEEGRNQLVLREPLPMPFPVRLLHGTADADVSTSVALRLMEHADSPDLRLTLVKGADHRFSDETCLGLIGKAIHSIDMAIK